MITQLGFHSRILILVVFVLNGHFACSYWMQWSPDSFARERKYEIKEKQQRHELSLRELYTKIIESRRSPFLYDVESLSWIISYDGYPFDLELIIIIITPVWIGLIFGFLVNICRSCQKAKEGVKFRPNVTLAMLQQSPLEQKLSLSHHQTEIDWYSKRFVIRANDTFIDIDKIIKNDREGKSPLRINPWRFARQIPKWIAWYLEYKQQEDTRLPPPVKEFEEGTALEFEEAEAEFRSKLWK